MGKLVADIIVETLQNAGVKHCYGVVGDTLNLIARSLEKSKIEWVSMRHEEAGAFAAQAEAQVADRLTAVAGNRPGETRCCRSDCAGGYLGRSRG
jgi:pyruvate dehydrogenase (quinone)